jgi:methylated-DNA-[protein]-cysteine S-methyltransferase
MSEQLGSAAVVLPSFFGAINVWIDQKVTGRDRFGQATEGAVTQIRIGEASSRFVTKSNLALTVTNFLESYLAGDLAAIDSIGVAQPGSEFKQQVWKAMRAINCGSALSYAALAQKAERPQAFRAAASACSHNAIPLVVPCHRVITSSGAIGKYFYGQEMKINLLTHEKYL